VHLVGSYYTDNYRPLHPALVLRPFVLRLFAVMLFANLRNFLIFVLSFSFSTLWLAAF